MKPPASNVATAWHSGGTVYVLAWKPTAPHHHGRPLTVEEASALHQRWLHDLLAAARRRETATVDLLKRFETDLREAIRASYRWRRCAAIEDARPDQFQPPAA